MTLEEIKQLANIGYSDYEIKQEIEKSKKEYPKKPVRPFLKDKHIPEEVLEYAEKLKQYEKDIDEYGSQHTEVRRYNLELEDVFIEYLKEKSGLLDFDEKTQNLITSFHYDVFSQRDGYIQYFQEIEQIIDFVNEIKKL